MFEPIKNLAKRFKRIDTDKIIKKILSNSSIKADIIDLNQQQMYDKGVDSEGKPLGDYAPFTIGYKLSPGPHDHRTDHITLKDTGEFYNSMRLKNEYTSFSITGDMAKTGSDLERIYPHALGLTEENKRQVGEWIKPLVIEKIKEEIRG